MSSITTNKVIMALTRHIGRSKSVGAKRMAHEILGSEPDLADLRCLRRVIQELRNEGMHICGHPSTGYYMAETAEELDNTCRFLFDRAMSSLKQVAAMKKVSLPDLSGQLNLPT